MSDVEQNRFDVLARALATYGYTAPDEAIGLHVDIKPRD